MHRRRSRHRRDRGGDLNGLTTRVVELLDPPNHTLKPRPRDDAGLAIGVIAIVCLAMLLPFASSAFRVDDPLFLWSARQIQAHPLDPYGFTVNWYGEPMAMAEVTKNPPLASYYVAAAATLLGWSETALHVAFALPALVLAIGTFLLARHWTDRPLLAALAAILTPVFLTCSVTVMSDVLMMAFWVTAVILWMRGLARSSARMLIAAGIAIAAAALTKYFGMTLIPLLGVYTVMREPRRSARLAYLLIPITLLALYQWATAEQYGRGLLLDAAAYASNGETGAVTRLSLPKAIVICAFAGGCLSSVLFLARALWSWRVVAAGATLSAAIAVTVATLATFERLFAQVGPDRVAFVAAQLGLWSSVGIGVLTLAVSELRARRSAESILLGLWLIGTFVFAGFVNWTTNGRSILPACVPVGILIAARIDRVRATGGSRRGVVVPLVAAAVTAIAVVWSDSTIANTARAGASRIAAQYGHRPSTLWFFGHWGFQYYLEQQGAQPIDVATADFREGDQLAVSTTNANSYEMPPEWVRQRETFELPTGGGITTINPNAGAGFYADAFGPLPFALTGSAVERFVIFDLLRR